MTFFLKSIQGAIVSPYETLEELADTENIRPASILILIVVAVLAAATLAIFLASTKSLLLALKTATITFATALITYALAVAAIFVVGRIVGSRRPWQAVGATWGFSYIPTAAWFSLLTLTHLLFTMPGPGGQLVVRTPDWANVVFIALSVAILLWKLLLYFIVLRVSLKLNFLQMIVASALLFVLTIIYSSATFMLGISKVPFI